MGVGQQPRRGVLKTVATMPFNLVRGGVALVAGGGEGGGVTSPRTPRTPAGDGLADQWIDFLIEQAERDGAAGVDIGSPGVDGGTPGVDDGPPVPSPGGAGSAPASRARVADKSGAALGFADVQIDAGAQLKPEAGS